MKIISGEYKGRTIEGFHLHGTRPTMDRVKESLFAMIQDKVKDSNVLDLFAGSGNLGIEAISNCAKKVTFVDYNVDAIKTIKKNLSNLKVNQDYTIMNISYDAFLKQATEKYDIIFLDPPYASNYIENAMELILKNELLKDDGLIVCEYENQTLFFESLYIWKEKKYGTKKITIFKKK